MQQPIDLPNDSQPTAEAFAGRLLPDGFLSLLEINV